jgi:hypothetical protein
MVVAQCKIRFFPRRDGLLRCVAPVEKGSKGPRRRRAALSSMILRGPARGRWALVREFIRRGVMRKIIFVLAGVIAVFGFMTDNAQAARKKRTEVTVYPWTWTWPWSVRDPRLATSNLVVGGAAAGTYFAINENRPLANGAAYAATSVGCAAVSPIVGTVVMGRPLTMREAHVTTANCFLPFVGGWIVNAAYDQHPEWEAPAKKR